MCSWRLPARSRAVPVSCRRSRSGARSLKYFNPWTSLDRIFDFSFGSSMVPAILAEKGYEKADAHKTCQTQEVFQDSEVSGMPQYLGQGWLANLVPNSCVGVPRFRRLANLVPNSCARVPYVVSVSPTLCLKDRSVIARWTKSEFN